MIQDKIFKLKGKVMHYAWGGYNFIPAWLGEDNSEKKPYAEYWLGVHPLATAEIEIAGKPISLRDAINENPVFFLGEKTFSQFGDLPFLFKVQDVKDMLSIQVHPSKAAAEQGFAAEEAAGILANAANRNYKDKNHKPEVMVALSEFWLLHGFLKKEKLLFVLKTIPEFAGFDEIFIGDGYEGLYKHVMHMPQQEINSLLLPLVKRELNRKKEGVLSKDDAGWWVAKLFDGVSEIKNIDRGIFSIYFFNIVKVNPGEGVFQGAGVPHAYLEGETMELMANSDNVLRGGLTPKHIDIPELMKHTAFEGIIPNVMKGNAVSNAEKNYTCPVPDFGISKIELATNEIYYGNTSSLEIFTVMKGEAEVAGSNALKVRTGEAFAIASNEKYSIRATANALLYKAFVP